MAFRMVEEHSRRVFQLRCENSTFNSKLCETRQCIYNAHRKAIDYSYNNIPKRMDAVVEKSILEKFICESIKQVYENDKQLILLSDSTINFLNEQKNADIAKTYYHAAERAVAFRFGLYLYPKVRECLEKENLDMDMEYNRHMYLEKITANFKNGISPDLIIHHRGNDNQNILVIEFKTWWNKDISDNNVSGNTLWKRDIIKLKDLTTKNSDKSLNYQYEMGLSIVFEQKETDCLNNLQWFAKEP